MFWWAPLASAAAGLILGNEQQKAQNRANKNQALLNMYAPLFGQEVKAMQPQQDHIIPGMVSGAIRGYEMAAGYDEQQAAKAMAERKMDLLERMAGGYGGGGQGIVMPQSYNLGLPTTNVFGNPYSH